MLGNQYYYIMQEVEEYFTNYIVNESLGIIANAHVVFADKEFLRAESLPCIQLAKLFSVAVDFPKTGVPAQIPHELHVRVSDLSHLCFQACNREALQGNKEAHTSHKVLHEGRGKAVL